MLSLLMSLVITYTPNITNITSVRLILNALFLRVITTDSSTQHINVGTINDKSPKLAIFPIKGKIATIPAIIILYLFFKFYFKCSLLN